MTIASNTQVGEVVKQNFKSSLFYPANHSALFVIRNLFILSAGGLSTLMQKAVRGYSQSKFSFKNPS